jgi:hypothetical protein
MARFPIIVIAAVVGLGLGVAIAATQGIEIIAAQDSINEAMAHLQKAGDPASDIKRARALAYLLLARTELQGEGRVQGLQSSN